MKNTTKQTSTAKNSIGFGKQLSYTEVIEFLDKNWSTSKDDKSLTCMKKLNQAFDSVAQKLDTIFITGTNGKSLTANFAAQLLKQEGLRVGCFYDPHILTYNERFSLNQEAITNKTFTELANEVLNTADTLGIKPGTKELLAMMALLHFKRMNSDIVLLEIDHQKIHHPLYICTPKIAAITRITSNTQEMTEADIHTAVMDTLSFIKKDTYVVSADQSKLHLQAMQTITTQKGGKWAMPIRKLATLNYPYEQLHGRCAALAERIAYVYVNTYAHKNTVIVANSLLTKQKGQRGRPTLEAKRQAELNPKKTLDQFWKETFSTLPGRFQLLDREKPSLLLDNANNLDAFKNVLLGIRLLHYQRPLKGLTLILSCDNPNLDLTELLKLLRYFFKKTSGGVIVCPITNSTNKAALKHWDVEKITNDIKSMKIKARSCTSFKEAFEAAQKSVDERHGLVAIAGSNGILTEYWHHKGLKKL